LREISESERARAERLPKSSSSLDLSNNSSSLYSGSSSNVNKYKSNMDINDTNIVLPILRFEVSPATTLL
jgi:hypothetical protein